MPHEFVLPESMDLPSIEENILNTWRKNDTFRKSLKLAFIFLIEFLNISFCS